MWNYKRRSTRISYNDWDISNWTRNNARSQPYTSTVTSQSQSALDTTQQIGTQLGFANRDRMNVWKFSVVADEKVLHRKIVDHACMHCNVLKSEIFTLFVYSSRIHSQIKMEGSSRPVCLCTKLGDVQKVPETPAVRPRGLEFLNFLSLLCPMILSASCNLLYVLYVHHSNTRHGTSVPPTYIVLTYPNALPLHSHSGYQPTNYPQ